MRASVLAQVSFWFIVYVALGPVAWTAFALATYFSWVRMNRLSVGIIEPLPASPPPVTVLIPAKDEGEAVRECLDRVLAMTYPSFDVVAIDDRSTDSTGAVMDDVAAKHAGRMRVMHIPQGGLPAGWLGKCNALHRATREVKSDWLLFVDSDVKVAPNALSTLLAVALARNYEAASIMTRLECHDFWERLILPLAAGTVGGITLMSFTNEDKKKHRAFANGQFFLIRRDAYEKVGGHEAVRDNITEDVALMRLLKKSGCRVRLYHGRQFASTRMHATWKQMFNGWARIYSGVCNRNPLRILIAAFAVLSALSAYVAFFIPQTHFLAAAHLLLVIIVVAVIYRLSGNPRRYALLFPLAGPILLALYANAIRACITGKIAWRGTNYTAGSAKGN